MRPIRLRQQVTTFSRRFAGRTRTNWHNVSLPSVSGTGGAAPFHSSSQGWHGHSHGGHGHSHGAAGAGAIARGSKEQQQAGVRVTVGGAVLNLALAGLKGTVGVACNSSALVSDAVHSLSDLLSDAITLFVVQTSRLPPDEKRPWGYGRRETMGSLAVSGLLFAAGIGVGYDAVGRLLAMAQAQASLHGQSLSLQSLQGLGTGTDRDAVAAAAGGGSTPPEIAEAAQQAVLDLVSEGSSGNYALAAAAVGVALFSVVSKEALFRWTLQVGSAIGSPTIVSNAWHHRSDALSSLTALVGVCGAIGGVPALDPAAGLVVSALIAQVALQQGRDALRELSEEQVGVDSALSKARRAAVSMEDVKCYRRVRGRRLGHYVLVEMEAGVSPQLTVSAAERVADRLRREIMRQATDVADVNIRTFAHRRGGALGVPEGMPGSSRSHDVQRRQGVGASPGSGRQDATGRTRIHAGECLCDDEFGLIGGGGEQAPGSEHGQVCIGLDGSDMDGLVSPGNGNDRDRDKGSASASRDLYGDHGHFHDLGGGESADNGHDHDHMHEHGHEHGHGRDGVLSHDEGADDNDHGTWTGDSERGGGADGDGDSVSALQRRILAAVLRGEREIKSVAHIRVYYQSSRTGTGAGAGAGADAESGLDQLDQEVSEADATVADGGGRKKKEQEVEVEGTIRAQRDGDREREGEGGASSGASSGAGVGATVQMEIQVDDSLSVKAAGRIALRVRRIVESVPGVLQADIHLEVDDMEACRFLLEHEAMGVSDRAGGGVSGMGRQ